MKAFNLYSVSELKGKTVFVGTFESEDLCFKIMNQYGVIDNALYKASGSPRWEIQQIEMSWPFEEPLNEIDPWHELESQGIGKI